MLVDLSPELLDQIAPAGYIFLMPLGTTSQSDEEVEASVEELFANPLWGQLHAVQAGRLALIDDHWFVGSLRAANTALDDIERILFDEG